MAQVPRHTILCLSSYFKGNRFLERCKDEGCHVILVTVEALLGEPWPRCKLDEVFALPSFENRRHVLNAVAYLARTRPIDRLVALDEFDVELAAALREHFCWPGMGQSAARLFRDKLAMRFRAREVGVRIPEFVPIIHHDEVRRFLDRVPGPWLIKPRTEASAAGIRRVHTPDEVWQTLDKLGDDQSFHLLEQMVPGELYHVDSLVAGGTVTFAAASKYERPLLEIWQGGGIFATRTLPPDHPDAVELLRLNAQVLQGFGMVQGTSHTEFMCGRSDGRFYLIETSARVGGSNIAELLESAYGINLWSEWAKVEIDRDEPYALPPLRNQHAGVIISLARQERPDTSGFADPEIVYRLDKKHHIGFVVCADSPGRVEALLEMYRERIARDFQAVLPAADKPVA
jgi:hypothetical protein